MRIPVLKSPPPRAAKDLSLNPNQDLYPACPGLFGKRPSGITGPRLLSDEERAVHRTVPPLLTEN